MALKEEIPSILASTKTMASGVVSTVVFGLTATEIGLIIAAISLLITALSAWSRYKFNVRKEQREIEAHDLMIRTRTIQTWDDEQP